MEFFFEFKEAIERYERDYNECLKVCKIVEENECFINGIKFSYRHFYNERKKYNTGFYFCNDLIVGVCFDWCENCSLFGIEY